MIGQLGAPVGFTGIASLFAYLYGNPEHGGFLDWGCAIPLRGLCHQRGGAVCPPASGGGQSLRQSCCSSVAANP